MHSPAYDTPRLSIRALAVHHIGPVDFDLAGGECLCLSGPSGAGKSLLLRAIADLDPHTGSICLDGTEQQSIPAPQWRREVGYLPAESHWWAEHVGAHFQQADAALLTGLDLRENVMDWEVTRCSTGERQRLALLRLLCNRPRVLLLDEPTANLDPRNALRAEELLLRYRDEHQAALLWVTHDPQQIARIAQRTLYLTDGRLTEQQP